MEVAGMSVEAAYAAYYVHAKEALILLGVDVVVVVVAVVAVVVHLMRLEESSGLVRDGL